MKSLQKIFQLFILMTASTFASGQNIGEYMKHHVADNREYWQILPFDWAKIPLAGEWMVGGINLYPSLHVIMMFVALALIIPIAVLSTKRINNIPTNRLGHLIESMVVFIRDDIAVPNIGKKQANLWLPYLCTVFIFLLVLNFIGLVPGMAGATGNISFTAAMAVSVFLIFNISGMIHNGPIKYFLNLVPHGVGIFALILFPIELVGLMTKSFALAIRLFANMAAGHFIIISLIGIITVIGSYLVAPVFVGLTLFIYCLKLLVVFLQAYVFTLLTSLFIGSAIHQDH